MTADDLNPIDVPALLESIITAALREADRTGCVPEAVHLSPPHHAALVRHEHWGPRYGEKILLVNGDLAVKVAPEQTEPFRLEVREPRFPHPGSYL